MRPTGHIRRQPLLDPAEGPMKFVLAALAIPVAAVAFVVAFLAAAVLVVIHGPPPQKRRGRIV